MGNSGITVPNGLCYLATPATDFMGGLPSRAQPSRDRGKHSGNRVPVTEWGGGRKPADGGATRMAKQFDTDGSPEWGLYVDEQRRDMTARKSIKVKLPIRQHIKLHALKLFSENNISQTVEAALDLYFDQMRAQEAASRLASSSSTEGVGVASAGADDGSHGSGSGPSVGPGGPSLPGPHGPGV